MISINKYKTWIFDCDGVILDSNGIKTEAFYEVALPYGKDNAAALVKYHKEYGGMSRFRKFDYFFKDILKMKVFDNEFARALEKYGSLVSKKMIGCPESQGLRSFLGLIPEKIRKIVVSGGMENELRDIFAKRGLSVYFNDIYGSPDAKEVILKREQKAGMIASPSIFIGDTQYDHECAQKIGADFIFMSGYTEFDGWKHYCDVKNVIVVQDLTYLKARLDGGKNS